MDQRCCRRRWRAWKLLLLVLLFLFASAPVFLLGEFSSMTTSPEWLSSLSSVSPSSVLDAARPPPTTTTPRTTRSTHPPRSSRAAGVHPRDGDVDIDDDLVVMGGMTRVDLPHGAFFFSPPSPAPPLPRGGRVDDGDDVASFPYSDLIDDQKKSLDDRAIDVERERERCARYGMELATSSLSTTADGEEEDDDDGRVAVRRRRLFAGSLIADEPVEVLRAVGLEAYDVFHTVSFVESNSTQTLVPRDWNYLVSGSTTSERRRRRRSSNDDTERLDELRGLFGPNTRVSVDYYVHGLPMNFPNDIGGWVDEMDREYMQREGSVYRWKMNGMREDDVGVILDADEVPSRDFLRALQVCDVPEFRPNQDCREPKVISYTMVYESSPNCARGSDEMWHHPDAILGECVDGIGNASLHPPTRRECAGGHCQRRYGYGRERDYSRYLAKGLGNVAGGGVGYPLWQPVDFRVEEGGRQIQMVQGSPTGYHFHNFFDRRGDINFKYHTYGHPRKAMELPMWEFSTELRFAVDCAHDKNDGAFDFLGTGSAVLPIYYLKENVRNARHQLWLKIVKEEEEYWNRTTFALAAEEVEDMRKRKRRRKRRNFSEKRRGKIEERVTKPPRTLNLTIGRNHERTTKEQ